VSATSGAGWNAGSRAVAAGTTLFALYATLLGVVWAVSASHGVRFGEAVGLRTAVGLRWYAAALGAAVLGWLFSAAFTAMLTALGVSVPREDLAIFRLMPSGPVGLAITVVLLVVVAPFAEEVIYRGVLLSALSSRWGSVVGLVGSTVVFSVVHLSWVGFVPLLVVGALFGLLFIKSRSLMVALVAHAAYNALGVVALVASKASGVL
jgi:membrane protease YdiL (CAAX protease family)